MSAFREMRTVINNQACLERALKSKFGNRDVVEVHDNAQPLYGYQGDFRTVDGVGHTKSVDKALKANVIVRRKHVGPSSNDIGFAKQEDGTYTALISDFDRQMNYGSGWMNSLVQKYQEERTSELMEESGAEFESRSVLPDGSIQLTYLA